MFKLFKKTKHAKPSLAVLYVEYGAEKGGKSDSIFATLNEYLSKIENCQITYLRIDNKYDNLGIQKINSTLYKVGGDNTFREFSGWQKGLAALKELDISCDMVLITNEMFLKPGPCFLQDYATNELLTKSFKENKVIGRIDTTHQEYRLFGYDVSQWICTNCFFVPQKALEQLNGFVLINENINEILKESYNPAHLIGQKTISKNDFDAGRFIITLTMPELHDSEIRFVADKSHFPADSQKIKNKKPLSLSLTNVSLNGTPLAKEHLVRGTRFENGARWAEQVFLMSLPDSNNAENTLTIEGFIPPEIFEKEYNNTLSLSLFNDALLFQENAPINNNYQRWLVEWLTERWHSKFVVNKETWDVFRTKTAAILNESLLTAKLKELGYNFETYGDKKYY